MRPNTQIRKKIQDYSYSMNDLLFQGNTSKIFKGIRQNTRQHVTIKVVNIQTFKSKEEKKALEYEIEAIKKLNHPNLLKSYDVYSTVNNCYIITEYCDGGSLKNLIQKKKNKLKEEDVNNIFKDIYKGYKHLYSKALVHRNLDPSNILIKNGQYKISDFGMTSSETSYQIKNTFTGSKVNYYHTDDIKAGILKPKCDVYALGVILYELYHKKTPLIDKNRNTVFEDIPSNAEDLIKKCLGLSGNDPMTIQQFSSHPYINYILYNNCVPPQVFKEDFRSVPLTKVLSNIENRPTSLKIDNVTETNKLKLENNIMAQLNFATYLYRLHEYLPQGDVHFVVVKHLFSILETLNQCIRGENPYNSECIVGFFANNRSMKIRETIKEYTNKYNDIKHFMSYYLQKGINNKSLQHYANNSFKRSEGFIITSFPIIVQFIKSSLQELKNTRELRSLKDTQLVGDIELCKIYRLDLVVTYYQLNELCLNNWNDLNQFCDHSKIQQVAEADLNFRYTKGSFKCIENKVRDLGII